MAKRCALSTGNLLRGGLPRNSLDRITDRPDMTSAVYSGRRASIQTKKHVQRCKPKKRKEIMDQFELSAKLFLLTKTHIISMGNIGNYILKMSDKMAK